MLRPRSAQLRSSKTHLAHCLLPVSSPRQKSPKSSPCQQPSQATAPLPWANPSCNHLPIASGRAFTELPISAACTPVKSSQNTARWGRNSMNFHHIGISGTIYITSVTMSLISRSNKYPAQSSDCNGWERKQHPERCHILETWPRKCDPQLTRWVRELLGLSKALWLSESESRCQAILKHPMYHQWFCCWY